MHSVHKLTNINKSQIVTVSRLSDQLVGLTKTQYISTVLDLTAHSEEALVNYRHHLLCTINKSEPHPFGLLKDRRNTPNGSTAAQKYADDCFVLQEYIRHTTGCIDVDTNALKSETVAIT